jgi:hypothetical protein
MLESPVPNPVASNPNIHTHKVFATVGLILIGAIIGIAGVWWYVQNQAETVSEDSETTSTKVSTSSAKASSSSGTDNWSYYSSEKYKYSYKYPDNWLSGACDDNYFHAPTKETLGICASEFGGMVGISYVDTDYSEYVSQDGFTDLSYLENGERQETTVGGAKAIKISGTYKDVQEGPVKNGAKRIFYIVNLKNKVLFLNYYSEQEWGDYSDTFEQIVSTVTLL